MHKSFFPLFIPILLVNTIAFAESGVGESISGFLTSLPPKAPELKSPVDCMMDVSDTAVVIWHSMPHTATYSLQVSSASDFNGFILTQSGLTDTSFQLTVLSASTTYHWRVCATNVAGPGDFSPIWHFTTAAFSTVEQQNSQIPQQYALLPAYPNPFNPTVTLTYLLPEQEFVSLVIINSMGQIVRELVNGVRQAGRHTVCWDGRDNEGASVTSGIYMSRLAAGSRVFTQKMLLMR